jgi:hypothetical protein
MTLSEYLPTYLLEHDLRPLYAEHLRRSVRYFEAFHPGITLEGITAAHVNR